MFLVGISGKMRTGKGAAAQSLVRDLGFERLAFADPVRQLAMELNPMVIATNAAVNLGEHNRLSWVVRGTSGWEDAKDRIPEVRRTLQNLGVGARTVLGEDVWVDALVKKAARYERVVVDDVRFQNEFEKIKSLGGCLIKVTRRAARTSGGLHVSETALDDVPDSDWDLIVENEATVSELQMQVVEFVKQQLRKAAKPEPAPMAGDFVKGFLAEAKAEEQIKASVGFAQSLEAMGEVSPVSE